MSLIQHLGTKDSPHQGTSGDDVMQGTSGDDWLYGAGGHDKIYGLEGNDNLVAGMIYVNGAWQSDPAGDLLDGGAGDDTLIGGAGPDQMFGGDGNDNISAGMLLVNGNWVHDTVGDFSDGGAGNDRLIGNDGADTLLGGSGNDELYGNAGNDTLRGGSGNDELYGNEGNDTLDGGGGMDEMFGGAGDDYYILRDRYGRVYDSEGKNSGIIMGDWIKPASGISWTWADGVQKLPYWIDALSFNAIGAIGSLLDAKHTVYYHFAQQTPSWFTSEDKNKFTPFNQAQQDVTLKVMKYISSLVNINFVPTNNPDQAYTIVLGNNEQANSGGYASGIRDDHGAALMVDYYSSSQNPDLDQGNNLTDLLLHEIGHSLHLKHPFGHSDADGNSGPGPFLPDAEEHKSLSVMSYTWDDAYHAPYGYGPFDLAALHYAYGVAPGARAGNDRYVLDAHSMNMLWDGNGIDTVDGSGQTQDMVIDLRPGYWSYIGAKADLISAAGQVTVDFGTVLENLLGGSGNDILNGNEAANTLNGGNGNDVLNGHAGNDTLAGGAGIDTAVFDGKRASYSIVRNGTDATVTDNQGADGKESLSGIEFIKFADSMVTMNTEGINADVFRLYQAAYDRKPDLAGLGYWMAMAEKGVTLKEIAAAFTGGQEFATLYGSKPDDATFLTKLYANVLHRPYDQGGYDFWLGALKSGVARDDVLIEFAGSKENVANVATLIANGIDYIPFG